MKERAVSGIVLMLLLTSMLTSSFIIQPVKAEPGTIYIRADGSVDPPTAPIFNVGNVYYTLTANIYGSIVVERDNIIIDGNGCALQSSGSEYYGFSALARPLNNVIIKSTNINGFPFGVFLAYSSNCIVSGNNISSNGIGVWLAFSSSNIIQRNNITGSSTHGIWVDYSSSNTVSENTMSNNRCGIWLNFCSDNSVYHNNFIDNALRQAGLYESYNTWDDGYPSGGNYWSDYTGVDADGDGIGDTPYIIDDHNRDRYPLMNPWTPTPRIGIEIVRPQEGEISWIEAEQTPRMPSITAQAKVIGIIPDPTAVTKFTWKAKCSYTAKVWTPVFQDGKYVSHTYLDYQFNHIFGPRTIEGGIWNLDFESIFCGGTLVISANAVIDGKEYQDSVTVYIKGKNPSRETIKSMLADPDVEPKVSNTFRQALSYKESVFCQFWSWPWQKDDPNKGFYSPYYDFSMPVYGPPGGYGLMQIDWPVDSSWNKDIYRWGQATQEEVMKKLREYQNGLMWNWLSNLKEGLTKIKEGIGITKTLEKQGVIKFTQEQFEKNSACLYNSGKHYFQWDAQTLQWLKIQYPIESGGYRGQMYADSIINIKNAVQSGEPPIGWYDP